MPSIPTLSNRPDVVQGPLVRVEHIDGAVYAIFTDPGTPGFEYDFTVIDAHDAMGWMAHAASKTWVTKEHLEAFAWAMRQAFQPSPQAVYRPIWFVGERRWIKQQLLPGVCRKAVPRALASLLSRALRLKTL